MTAATSAEATAQNVAARRRPPYITDAYYESMAEFLDTITHMVYPRDLGEHARTLAPRPCL